MQNSQSDAIDPVALLQALVRRPSITPDDAGSLDIIEQALTRLAFTVTRLRFEGDGSYPVNNLFATRGSGGKHLLFSGHTDVVPPGDLSAWTHDPFAAEIVDGVLYGRGAADMKSGIAAFIAGVDAAVANGSADRGTISLAITNDEEAEAINGTEKLMAWMAARGHRFDFAIVGEPSANAQVGDCIKAGRRGSINGRITVTGASGHVAYPDKARNPLPVVAAIVTALSGKLDEGTPYFPPSNLEFTSIDVGNATSNVVPAVATLLCNARFNDNWTPDSIEAAIRTALDNVDAPGVAIVFELVERPSRSFLSSLGAVETLQATIERLTGARPELSTGGGTSDSRFIAPYVPVVECGLQGTGMHGANERVAIADIMALMNLYAAFIGDYFR